MSDKTFDYAAVRVGSLFSGIGGFDLGLERAGFEVAFQCDNDPFCNKVLAHHWPGVKRYDDVRDIGLREPLCEKRAGSAVADSATTQGAVGRDGQGRRGAGDLICGGFPCQDLSVAGKRAGLDGGRSGLWFEFKRILSELRPQWAIIENVPGLLSSNSGRDFAVVLDGLGGCGFAGISWAVLDSQHFGVAQRRRRVYVVAGPSRRSVEQVLSLCEGCGGHPPARREAGQDVASPTLVGTLEARDWKGVGYDSESRLVAHSLRADGFDASEDGTGRGTPLTVIQDARGVRDKKQNGIGIQQSETMYTLVGTSQHAVHNASVRRLTPMECERLQGFPDGWTDVGGAADGPRYKALGNAVSVPVIEYLGLRIAAVARGTYGDVMSDKTS